MNGKKTEDFVPVWLRYTLITAVILAILMFALKSGPVTPRFPGGLRP